LIGLVLISFVHNHLRGNWRRDVGRDKYRDKMINEKIEENWPRNLFVTGRGGRYYQRIWIAHRFLFCRLFFAAVQFPAYWCFSERIFFLLFMTRIFTKIFGRFLFSLWRKERWNRNEQVCAGMHREYVDSNIILKEKFFSVFCF